MQGQTRLTKTPSAGRRSAAWSCWSHADKRPLAGRYGTTWGSPKGALIIKMREPVEKYDVVGAVLGLSNLGAG